MSSKSNPADSTACVSSSSLTGRSEETLAVPLSRLTFAVTPSNAFSAAFTLRQQFSQRIPPIFMLRLPMGADSLLALIRGCFSVPQQFFFPVKHLTSDHTHAPMIPTARKIGIIHISTHPFPIDDYCCTVLPSAASAAFFTVAAAIGGHHRFLT